MVISDSDSVSDTAEAGRLLQNVIKHVPAARTTAGPKKIFIRSIPRITGSQGSDVDRNAELSGAVLSPVTPEPQCKPVDDNVVATTSNSSVSPGPLHSWFNLQSMMAPVLIY